VKRRIRVGALLVCLALFFGLIPARAATELPADPALRALGDQRGLSIGTAVGAGSLANPAYAATVRTEFNVVTPENEMKWNSIHPEPTVYNFAGGDAIVAFAQQNGMKVRGHNLAWYSANPSWLITMCNDPTVTRDQAIAVLKDHIDTVVGHYKGKIAQWDVVNEALYDDGTLRAGCGTGQTPWGKMIGSDYIDLAFQFAHAADPAAKLFYNDYNAEALGTKSDAVYNLVAGLKQRGIPIDGVGLQMHFDLGAPSAADVASNMSRLNALGVEVGITEMDVRLFLPAGDAQLAQQRRVFHDMLATCLAAANCHTFVMWGFTDADSWIPSYFPGYGAATPFDSTYNPKPAYFGLRDALGMQTDETKVVEAENMSTKTVGASTLGGWELSANGEVGNYFPFPGGNTTITVVAKGVQGGGAWPTMDLKVDGAVVATFTVASSSWAPYSFTTAAYSVGHNVSVAFTNDYYAPPQDRNLFVDKVSVGSVVEAENTEVKSVGHAVTGGWELDQNGYVEHPAQFWTGGLFNFTVVASGTFANGAWPTLAVRIDQVTVGQVTVSSSGWQTYTVLGVAPPGRHRVSLAFTNDYYSPPQDRNLFIDSFSVAGAPTLTP